MILRHIYELTGAILACLAAYIFLIQISTKNIRGTRWLVLAYVSGAIGVELIGQRDRIPDLLSIPLGNFLVLLGNLFVYWGYGELMKLGKRRYWLLYATVLPGLFCITYFTYVHPLLGPRIVTYNVFTAAQYLFLSWLLVKNGIVQSKMPRYVIAIVYALWALLNVRRAASIDIQDAAVARQWFSQVTSMWSVLAVLTTMLTGAGFIWLAMVYLHADLEVQSGTDPLTGLLNRFAFAEVAKRDVLRSRRQVSALSIVAIDLDLFKKINDTHGHAAGDAALRQTALCLTENLRAVDVIARFGGEEFVALLPDTDGLRACEVAERLRSELVALRVPFDGDTLTFSASFGVATLAPPDPTWEAVLDRADRALYAAKDKGRNRVEFDDAERRERSGN